MDDRVGSTLVLILWKLSSPPAVVCTIQGSFGGHTPDCVKLSLKHLDRVSQYWVKVPWGMVILSTSLAHMDICFFRHLQREMVISGAKQRPGLSNCKFSQSRCSKPWNVTCLILWAYSCRLLQKAGSLQGPLATNLGSMKSRYGMFFL